jgi:thiol-disulfide isomerase/thioredoxin
MAEVKMKSVNGSEYDIKSLKTDKGVLVMFSCNTCPVVVKYQSRTLEAIQEAKAKGFGVIIINSNEDYRDDDDSYTEMQDYAKAQNYQDVPYVVDVNSAVANAFGASRTPETFLFNAEGKLVYHGAMDDNQDASKAKRKHLSSAINELVSGKEVSVNSTLSVGCSIKRKA